MKLRFQIFIEVIGLVLVLGICTVLRFYNIGYSEYGPDETTVMYPVKHNAFLTKDLLLSQRKGPVQFIVAKFMQQLSFTVTTEFAFRVPFAIAQILGFVFLYLAVKNITGVPAIGLLSTLILSLNGFTVAFGRIVQYQSFNMLFSFASIWLLSLLAKNQLVLKKACLVSGIASLSWFLSFISHWDAIFIFPIQLILLYRIYQLYIKTNFIKIAVVFVGGLALLLIPFTFSYINAATQNTNDVTYFNSRIGYEKLTRGLLFEKYSEYKTRSELYNPFYYMPFVLVTLLLSLLEFKKSKPFYIWSVLTGLVFVFAVKRSGTHIYNVYIPLSILSAIGIYGVAKYFKHYFAVIPVCAVSLCAAFGAYQNYLLFCDPSTQYPWEQEIVGKFKTRFFDQKSLSNNIIGFPINRNWTEINQLVLKDAITRGIEPTYITNEVRSISQFYMDIPMGVSPNLYAVGIKNPFSFEKDYSFPQIHNRETISKVYFEGKNTARIYFVENSIR